MIKKDPTATSSKPNREGSEQRRARSVTWKQDSIVSLRLRDDLHTLAQMMRSPYMRFFDVSNSSGEWKDLDLNQVPILFCVLVGQVVLQELVEGKVKDKSVKASILPFENKWIAAELCFGEEYPFKGGKLLEVDPNVGTYEAKTLNPRLSIESDLHIIRKYELTNMWGASDLRERLLEYFDSGIDRNRLKAKVFRVSENLFLRKRSDLS